MLERRERERVGSERESIEQIPNTNKTMAEVEANSDGEAIIPPQNTETEEPTQNEGNAPVATLSKNAKKKLARQQRWEAKKAEKKAAAKEHKKKEAERKRNEWNESLSNVPEEERTKLIESRKSLRKERMEKRSLEKDSKRERLTLARENGQNVVVDLQFSHLMTPNEIRSLVQQVHFSIINKLK